MKPSVRAKNPNGGLSWKGSNIPPPSSTGTKPARLQDLDIHRPMEKMAMTSDWIHDKYKAEPLVRVENIESRKPEYCNGSAVQFSGPTDPYKPSLRSDYRHRGDSHDFESYNPLSRGADERGNDGRHVVNKPTVYASLHDYIVKKAFSASISAASYYDIYYRSGEKAKKDKPYASAYWLLWRQECLIWKKFFPGEGFIGIEPKVKPTTADTKTEYFSLMSAKQLERTFKSSPAYGRLTQETGPLPNSLPKGSFHRPRDPRAWPSASITSTRKECLEQPEYLSQAQLIKSKARSRNFPPERLMTLHSEKQKLAESHFPKESNSWHLWFAEASVWGHFFKDLPFPGVEPRSACDLRSGDNDGSAFSYLPQEKVMEQMALRKGIRKEFFQFLNTTRHDAIAVHPLCNCYARNFLADRLTWRQFFKEPFPVARPHQDHSDSCMVKTRPVPCFSQTQTKTTIRPSGAKFEGIVLGPQFSTAAIKGAAPSVNNPSPSAESHHVPCQSAVQSQAPTNRMGPLASQLQFSSNNFRSHPAAFHFASSPSSILTQVLLTSQSSQAQKNYISTSGQARSQLVQSEGLALANLKEREINTQSEITAIPASPARGPSDISPPPSILSALSELRTSKEIPEGSVVMQNRDATVCNSDSVAQMLRCLQSEDAASIDSISNGLKCLFRYRGNLNGDLLLWIEPFIAGDTSAFTGGHLFLKGWVQRNIGFGIVALSSYWNEIRNTASFSQTGTTPTPVIEVSSHLKAEWESGTSPSKTLDGVKDARGENATISVKDAVLIIRGDTLENIPCSRAALKNLTFSFIIDSCKDKVEERLQCTFSLTELEGHNKYGGCGLDLTVKPFWGGNRDRLQKATRFVRSWAIYAIQPTTYKASTFLASPEGLHILGNSSASLANTEAENYSSGPGKHQEESKPPLNVSDLDLMLAEETAKAEGSSRLVLDEVTGQVITVRELLKKVLYRASNKILGSSATAEDHEKDNIPISGTDDDMNDLCGEHLDLVDHSKEFEISGGKRQASEEEVESERARKRFCATMDGNDIPEIAVDTVEQVKMRVPMGVDDETTETVSDGGANAAAFGGPAAIPLEDSLGVVKASEAAT